MLLAFVEDCQYYEDPVTAPAYQYLVGLFDLSKSELTSLMKYAHTIEKYPLFPEQVLFEWKVKRIYEGQKDGIH